MVGDDSRNGGLYRVDLADLDDGPLSLADDAGRKVRRIFNHPHLSTFKVDHSNSRIFLINADSETVIAISLDG